MAERIRFLGQVLSERLAHTRVAFVSGPSQVGKTACCSALSSRVLDWNDVADRLVMLRGPESVARQLGLARRRDDVIVVFDNLHGNLKWKSFVRRLLAHCGPRVRVAITTLYPARVPGRRLPPDSFQLRINPLSVGECARAAVVPDSLIQPPAPLGDEDWAALLEHGGFPEPFIRRDVNFTRRWNAKRNQQLIGHDLPLFAAVRDPSLVQMLAMLLAERSARHLVYSDLSRELGVAVDTVRRWIEVLVGLQYGFLVRPWSTRVPKALRKEPKWFLRDWSSIADPGARARTFVACHLLKAAEGWHDLGYGSFEVRYVCDKLKREVDFLMLRDRKPWFLVEVSEEAAGGEPTASLSYFQRCTRAQHAFQVSMDAAYAAVDCFERADPTVIPARTFLSQLL